MIKNACFLKEKGRKRVQIVKDDSNSKILRILRSIFSTEGSFGIEKKSALGIM